MTTRIPSDISAVFFDMDETLVRHTRTGYEICQDVFRAFSDSLAPVDEEAFIQTLAAKAGDLWKMMFDGVIDGEVARPYTFINTLRTLEADESLGEALLESFESLLVESTVLADGALDVLGAFRDADVCTGIVTNGYTAMQTRKLEHHRLMERVDFILISEAVGSHKPDRGIFEEALRRADVAPGSALFVGDNLKNDIAGAEAAGIAAVLIDPKGHRRKRLKEDPSLVQPSHIIEQLEETLALAGLGDRVGG